MNEWLAFLLRTLNNRHLTFTKVKNNNDNLLITEKYKKFYFVKCLLSSFVCVTFQPLLVKRFGYFRPFLFGWRKCRCLQLLLKCSSGPLICPSEPSLVKLQPANWTSGEINGGKWKMIFSQLFPHSSLPVSGVWISWKLCSIQDVLWFIVSPEGSPLWITNKKLRSLSQFTPEPSVWYP